MPDSDVPPSKTDAQLQTSFKPTSSGGSRTTEDILDERKTVHGPFSDNARISQQLKAVMEDQPGWRKLTPVHKEALHMIVHKIARILAGDPTYNDHWDDIAGYGKLPTRYQ